MFDNWLFAEREEDRGVEWKDSDLFFFDACRAEPAHEDVLVRVYDLSDAGLADGVVAAG